jgi:hypothetical protein
VQRPQVFGLIIFSYSSAALDAWLLSRAGEAALLAGYRYY